MPLALRRALHGVSERMRAFGASQPMTQQRRNEHESQTSIRRGGRRGNGARHLAIGAATANAAPLTGSTESITINEALEGQTFQAYQLATFTDATGANGVINDLAMSTPAAANAALKKAINARMTPIRQVGRRMWI